MKKTTISLKQFCISFVPMAIIAIFASVSFIKVSSKIIDNNLTSKANSVVNELSSSVLKSLENSIQKLSNWSEIVKTVEEKSELRKVMNGMSYNLPSDSMIYYSTLEKNENGGFFLSYPEWEPPKEIVLQERSWFLAAVKGNEKLIYSEPYVDLKTNTVCVTLSKSSVKNGKLLGVSGLDITLNGLVELLKNVEISKKSKVYLVTNDGKYLSNKDESKIYNKNYFEESAIKNFYSPSEYLNDKEKSIIKDGNFYAVKKVGETPWFAVIEGPVSDFHTDFQKFVLIIIAVLVILAICGAISINYAVASMRKNELVLGEKIESETRNLAVAAKENAATSQDQSAAVKEIVATMEDNTELSSNISTKIKDVASIATKTTEDVSDGVSALEKNVQKLHEIFDANQETISGIKQLGEKIENIWDIVTLINSVADQAKIIAFNAELEASSAGEAGKNFHIVATEIRRLADGIIDGTKEIKDRINEIQQSSDSLILTSESGTEKINEGCESAKELEEKFANIKNASEITAKSSDDITSIIQQQTIASEQILITLKQIASGIENFSQATESISKTAENLQSVSSELNK